MCVHSVTGVETAFVNGVCRGRRANQTEIRFVPDPSSNQQIRAAVTHIRVEDCIVFAILGKCIIKVYIIK